MLLEHPGQVVTREELQKRLWPADTFVDFDHSLGTAIGKLRQALGDSAQNPRFVETLGGRGYRFIAPVVGSGEISKLPIESHITATQAPAAETIAAVREKTTAGPPKAWLVGGTASVLAMGAILIALNVGGWRDQILPRGRPAEIGSLAVLPLENPFARSRSGIFCGWHDRRTNH